MRILTMEPARVFYYFEEISRIPRGSGNTKAVSDYCVTFAREHGLRVIQDEWNNVIIFKDASAGKEKSEPVILQGHLDMVCEKNIDCAHDFEKEGIHLLVEDGQIRADGTTLGGDDGIAIAYALAVLESDQIEHPPIEAVFTVDEETGMFGASGLDTTVLSGSRVINLDSEEEGILLTSCAGGVKCTCTLPVRYQPAEDRTDVRILVTGLQGGHSGTEIDKGHCNADKLMGRLIFSLNEQMDIGIVSLNGGLQDNAIPREAQAVCSIAGEDIAALQQVVKNLEQIVRKELGSKDPSLRIETEVLGPSTRMLTPSSTQKVIFLLVQAPNGVQEMSADIPGLVETSLNLGIMQLTGEALVLSFALRSSCKTAKEALKEKLAYLVEFLGGVCECNGDYPAWEYKKDSSFRQLCIDAYEKVYKEKPQIMALHAGLECGILADKIPDFDAVSMGPDIFDIHTPNEHMSIDSVQRTWEFLKEILRRA